MQVSSLRGGGRGKGEEENEYQRKVWDRVFFFISFQDLYHIFCWTASSSDPSDGYVCCALKKIKRERKRVSIKLYTQKQ